MCSNDQNLTESAAGAVSLDEPSLVDLVESFPHLWNKNHAKFKDKIAIENSWQSIAHILEFTPQECEHLWTSIRLKYTRERRKIKNIPSGAAAYSTKWPLFERLGFLAEAISTRRTKGNTILQKKNMVTKPSNVWKRDVENMFTEEGNSEDQLPQLESTEYQMEMNDESSNGIVEQESPESLPHPPKLRKVEELKVNRNKKMNEKKVSSASVDKLIESCSSLGASLTSMMNNVVGDNQITYDENQLFGLSIAESLRKIESDQKRMRLKVKIMALIAEEGFD